MKRTVLALLTFALVALPAAAMDHVPPGVDLFVTPGNGQTYMDFASNPVPAGFFCPGSQPFTDRVEFRGVPLAGAPNNVDTIIERIDEASLNEKGVGTTRIRVRAVQLESLKPLSTSCGEFILRASLASREQPISRMRIRQTEENGGFFTAALSLNLRLVFTPVSDIGPARVLESTLTFDRSNRIPWASAPEESRQVQTVTVDTDADGRPDTRLTVSPSFVAGFSGSRHERNGGTLFGAPQALSTTDTDAVSHASLDHEHEVMCGQYYC